MKYVVKTESVRLPCEIIKIIRDMARENERTFIGQTTWLIKQAIKKEGRM